MKSSVKSKIIALLIAVLLVAGMAPAVYAKSSSARIILGGNNVKLKVGESTTISVDYTELEELDDAPDISRAKIFVDKYEVAEADFDSDGADLTSIKVTGLADGETAIIVKVGRFYSQFTAIVGRGNKSPAQIKKEEAAKKADEELITKDTSALGKALAEAIKKTEKKNIEITTTTAKDPVIPVSTMKSLAARANQAKKNAVIRVDSLDSNGKVFAQLYVDPSLLTTIKSDFKTDITVDTSRKASLGAKYIASVKCSYTGNFIGFTEVAAKVGSVPKDMSKIEVYNVDANGKLKKIDEPSCSLDKNGLLHFFTKSGGEIVIMQGEGTASEK